VPEVSGPKSCSFAPAKAALHAFELASQQPDNVRVIKKHPKNSCCNWDGSKNLGGAVLWFL